MNIMQWSRNFNAKIASFFGRQQPQQSNKKQTFIVESKHVEFDPENVRPTKLYADQRQKAVHNRKRKPSKAMKNLYRLKG